jgi:hypothetical protein
MLSPFLLNGQEDTNPFLDPRKAGGSEPSILNIDGLTGHLQTHRATRNKDLDQLAGKYLMALDAQFDKAADNGELNLAKAFQHEAKLVKGVRQTIQSPTKDNLLSDLSVMIELPALEDNAPAELTQLRKIWDTQYGQFREKNNEKLKADLKNYVALLTKNRELDKAQAVADFSISLGKNSSEKPETTSTDSAEWKSLFDGKTLQGWMPVPAGQANFTVKDGAILIKGTKGQLVSNHTLTSDFEFQAEVMSTGDSNSGIFLHTNKTGRMNSDSFMEVAIAISDQSAGQKGYYTGSLWGSAGIQNPQIRDDEWVTLTIKRQGEKISTTLNGKQVVDFDTSSNQLTRGLSGGFLSLQANTKAGDHLTMVRNIRIRNLPHPKVAQMNLPQPTVAQDAFSKNEFDRIQSDLQLDTDATWRSIPWQTSLLKAQAIAARERKPIFLWAMNGNPLGCT